MNNVLEVFWRFFALGCISFGGPAAHIGYFQKVFVQKLGWLDDDAYAKLITLSQFLPGPGSSQVGFSIGLRRAGLLGGLAAFIGFTLPSFLLLYLLSILSAGYTDNTIFSGVVSGLKLLAVVVVADATLTMFKAFCKNNLSIIIAMMAAVTILVVPGFWVQMFVLITAAAVGVFFGQSTTRNEKVAGRVKLWPLVIFVVIFSMTPFLSQATLWLHLFSDFYQAGSLVFGGGHVVLPLLQELTIDSVDGDSFLLGYGAAQGVPGPMFSIAAFLGAQILPNEPLLGAVIATVAVFLPGFLLVLGVQGAWQKLAAYPKIAGASWGVNAAVVGLLLSALYQPVFISAVTSAIDMAAVILGLVMLRVLNIHVGLLVLGFAVVGVTLQF